MREKIDVFEYAPQILKALKQGVLITAKADGRVNPMTFGWGMLGIEWGKPVFICYVRQGRYTHELLEHADCFTVNVPVPSGDVAKDKRTREILAMCGTKSGRDTDKVLDLGLTLANGENVDAPAVLELPLTLECQVIYRRDQDIDLLPKEMRSRYYPQDVPGSEPGANGDRHTEYYGEIVDAYILR